jgi:hypothetical protein
MTVRFSGSTPWARVKTFLNIAGQVVVTLLATPPQEPQVDTFSRVLTPEEQEEVETLKQFLMNPNSTRGIRERADKARSLAALIGEDAVTQWARDPNTGLSQDLRSSVTLALGKREKPWSI